MEAAVHQRRFEVYDWESGDDPLGQGLLDPFLDGGDVLPGDRPAHDLVGELEARSPMERFEVQSDVAVLTMPSRLLLVLVIDGRLD